MTPSQRVFFARRSRAWCRCRGASGCSSTTASSSSTRRCARSSVATRSARRRCCVNALTLAVLRLLDEGRASKAVHDLGARHRAYGVLDEHYASFGEALLWTFEQRLGDGFTPELRGAWSEAWSEIALAMQQRGRRRSACQRAPSGRRRRCETRTPTATASELAAPPSAARAGSRPAPSPPSWSISLSAGVSGRPTGGRSQRAICRCSPLWCSVACLSSSPSSARRCAASSGPTCSPASPSSPPCCSASTSPARWSCSCSRAGRRSSRSRRAQRLVGTRRRWRERMPSVAHRRRDGRRGGRTRRGGDRRHLLEVFHTRSAPSTARSSRGTA
jgi:hypothetical protein